MIGSRLSEDTNKTVLVIEAGATGDEVKSSIDVPGNAYYSSLLNTDYDWQCGYRLLCYRDGVILIQVLVCRQDCPAGALG